MEDLKQTMFRKIDQAVFERIDKFKQTPNYTPIQDFYNSLEEDQQKLFKGVIIVAIFLLPILGLSFVSMQNSGYDNDLTLRTEIVSKANEIIGQSQGLEEIAPQVFSPNPIDSQSMMTSRLSGLLSSVAIDLSKIQVNGFVSETISSSVMKAEANFAFSNLSTDEMVNLFTAMISREKFRISSVEIKRNSNTNLLQGQFHAIHYSSVVSVGDE
jgi:hypothetical protein